MASQIHLEGNSYLPAGRLIEGTLFLNLEKRKMCVRRIHVVPTFRIKESNVGFDTKSTFPSRYGKA